MYINFFQYPLPPSFWYKQKNGEDEIQLARRIEGMDFFRSYFFYVFIDEVAIKIFVYLLIANPSLYGNIVNLFEHDMET